MCKAVHLLNSAKIASLPPLASYHRLQFQDPSYILEAIRSSSSRIRALESGSYRHHDPCQRNGCSNVEVRNVPVILIRACEAFVLLCNATIKRLSCPAPGFCSVIYTTVLSRIKSATFYNNTRLLARGLIHSTACTNLVNDSRLRMSLELVTSKASLRLAKHEKRCHPTLNLERRRPTCDICRQAAE
jgi:hypothetical protein